MGRCRLLVPVLLLLASVAVGAPQAWADDNESEEEEHDHERAREAVERGEVLPLEQVLDAVRGRIDGHIIGVEFERDHGFWIYEFRVVEDGGRVVEILTDARTAEIIGIEGE